MIRSFRHRGLERFYLYGDHRGVPADFAPRLERILDNLNAANAPIEMNMPSFRFHRLKGSRAGVYAVNVSGNWRVTFEFASGHAIRVNLEDYH